MVLLSRGGASASVIVVSVEAPLVSTVTTRLSPAFFSCKSKSSALASLTTLPSSLVTISPGLRPAFAAGLPGCTRRTCNPSSAVSPNVNPATGSSSLIDIGRLLAAVVIVRVWVLPLRATLIAKTEPGGFPISRSRKSVTVLGSALLTDLMMSPGFAPMVAAGEPGTTSFIVSPDLVDSTPIPTQELRPVLRAGPLNSCATLIAVAVVRYSARAVSSAAGSKAAKGLELRRREATNCVISKPNRVLLRQSSEKVESRKKKVVARLDARHNLIRS